MAELQPKLLEYRLQNLAKVHQARFELPGCDSGLRILAQALGACIVGAPELLMTLGSMLGLQQENISAGRWTDLQCVVLEVLLDSCHDEQQYRLYVGGIADKVNILLKSRGETRTENPRLIGAIVRQFGFLPVRDGKGYSIVLTDRIRCDIHRLARDRDVAAVQTGIAVCEWCAEFRAPGTWCTS